jgi:hypothetical protein
MKMEKKSIKKKTKKNDPSQPGLICQIHNPSHETKITQ